jgi:probable HAF family extracellular repeat protein
MRAAVLAVFLAGYALADATYRLQELVGVPNGMGSWAEDLNNRGEVVGWGADDTGEYRAMHWNSRGQMTNLGGVGPNSSKAYGISEGGMVVGYSDANGNYGEAVYWKNGNRMFLGFLPGDIGSIAYDANDNGVIVGLSYNWAGDTTPVMWINGVITQVGPRHAWVAGISGGNVSGGRINVTSWPEAVLFSPSSMTPLPGLGSEEGYVYDINEPGVAVGTAVSPIDNRYHAVFWRNAQIEDKGVVMPDSGGVYAYGINNREHFVGKWFPPTGNHRTFACIRGVGIDIETSISNLGTWTINDVYDINDGGMIIGQGYAGGGQWYDRAFVLRPPTVAR